jgi:hypothetical protein
MARRKKIFPTSIIIQMIIAPVVIIGCVIFFMFGVNSIRKHKSVVIREVQNFQIENHANASFILDGEKVKFLKKSVQVMSGITMIKK